MRRELIWLLLWPSLAFGGTANLTWSAPTQNVDGTPLTDLAGFRGYESCNGGPQSQVFQVGASVLAHTVTHADDGSTCSYWVSAYTAAEESAKTGPVAKTFTAPPLGIPGPVLLTVTWTATPLPPAPAFDEGFNFRDTLGYVTDPANTQAVLASHTYPRTSGGVTFGWVGQAANNPRDRNSGIDPRLAGVHWNNNAAPRQFRIDLPAPRTYQIRIAAGDAGDIFGSMVHGFRLLDGSTVFATVSGVTQGGANRYVDATGVLRTSPTAWVSGNQSVTRTFATTTLIVEIGNGPSAASGIAHIRVTAQ